MSKAFDVLANLLCRLSEAFGEGCACAPSRRIERASYAPRFVEDLYRGNRVLWETKGDVGAAGVARRSERTGLGDGSNRPAEQNEFIGGMKGPQ